MKNIITFLIFIIGFTSFAQVGINTTSPTAMLHVYGTTVPGSAGGTVNLITQDFSSYTVTQNHTNDTDCTGNATQGWVTGTGNANVNCTSCTGTWLYISSDALSCGLNSTAIMNFTTAPTTTSVNISFAYRYNNFGAAPDSFRAYLYNNTTSTQVGGNLVNLTTDANTTYSGTATVIAGNNYSIRFEYQGNYDYGASVDNVLITETSVASPGTYSFRLEDGTQAAGKVLTSDINGNGYWQTPTGGGSGTDSQTLSISGNNLTISNGNTVTLPSGGSGSNTYTNGLTLTGSTVRLGGALTQATYLDLNSRDLYFEGTGTGDITFEGNSGQPVMQTNFGEDYVNFGAGGAFVDADEGQTFSDTYSGGPFTKKFVAGFYKGSSGGTAIALGSIEYIVDGTNELFYEGSGFSPMSDFGSDLGASPFSGVTRRWDDVYADDFITPTNTYGRTTRKTTTITNRGLKELMQLNLITYKENTPLNGKTEVPEHLKADKLGFDSIELAGLIPEAVKTSDWISLDESGKRTYVKYEKPVGVMPYQLIPVTVKAIQEQQEQIEELKEEIKFLKEAIELLKNKQ